MARPVMAVPDVLTWADGVATTTGLVFQVAEMVPPPEALSPKVMPVTAPPAPSVTT